MQPLATILLDTPDSAGPVRGVVLYRRDRGVLYVLDPRTPEPQRAAVCRNLDDALQYVADAWGAVEWDLTWLCEADDLEPEPCTTVQRARGPSRG